MRITGRSSMSFRSLQEFIAGVGELQKDRSPVPDFGGLYFITAVDILPEKYKVWMSLEKRLTPDQIQGAMGVVGRAFPYGIIPQRAPDFAGWRYVPHDWQDYAKFTR